MFSRRLFSLRDNSVCDVFAAACGITFTLDAHNLAVLNSKIFCYWILGQNLWKMVILNPVFD